MQMLRQVGAATAAIPGRLWSGLTTRPTSVYGQNERWLLVDGAAAGVVNGVAVFLPVFLVRLGASDLQVGGVAGLPALTAAVLSIPVGAFLARRTRILAWLAVPRLLVWLSYPLIGLLPFVLRARLPDAIMVVWALATFPQVVHVVAVTVVLGAVVDDAHRFRLLSRRWAAAALASAGTIAVIGQVVSRAEFPAGYQFVFIGSLAASLVSLWAISRVQMVQPAAAEPHPPGLGGWRQMRDELLGNRAFLRFLAMEFVFHIGLMLVVPLLPIYWVRTVEASDNAIGIIASVQTLVTMPAYFWWTRAAGRRGKRWVLLVSCLGLSLYPAMTAATREVSLLVVWAALAGFFAAGVDLTFLDLVMGAGRPAAQPLYVGLYTTSANTAAFVAPMLGPVIASAIGIGPALVLGTGLRLAGVGLMILLQVGATPKAEVAKADHVHQPIETNPAG